MLDVGDVDGDAGTFGCFLNLVIVCGDGVCLSLCLRLACGWLRAHSVPMLHRHSTVAGVWGPQSPALFNPLFSNFVTTSILVLSFC